MVGETSTVTVEVLDIAESPGNGRLIGLAQVAITLDGVEVTLQGVRLLRRADGLTGVEMPAYRHVDGYLAPAVVVPEELEEAVARAVLERAGARVVVRIAPARDSGNDAPNGGEAEGWYSDQPSASKQATLA